MVKFMVIFPMGDRIPKKSPEKQRQENGGHVTYDLWQIHGPTAYLPTNLEHKNQPFM